MMDPYQSSEAMGVDLAQAWESIVERQPRSAVEQAVVDIWRQVLPDSAVSPEVDFFELGGDALAATQIVACARQVLGAELDVSELLDRPTPAGMARQVEAAWKNGGQPLLQGAGPAASPQRALTPGGPFHLSFTQERLWFIQQMDPLSGAYNLAGAVRLRGSFNLEALQAALGELARRHETLRTTFVLVDGEPRQCIHEPQPITVRLMEAASLADAYALSEADARQPFDLARGPLLRATAFRLADDDQVLLVAMHHIISDAWSLGVLSRELVALYAAARRGQAATLPELPIQYADFAAWQRATLQGEALAGELAYWRRKLAGATRLELPLDHSRLSAQSYRGATEGAELDPTLLRQLRRVSQRANATLSMTLLAAFQVLLQRYTGQDDIAVGLPIANRRHEEVEGLIGAFSNTLVLRSDLSGDPPFRELLARVRQDSLEAYAHQDMPFAKLVAELKPERSLSTTPLVQVSFNHINVPLPAARLDALHSEYVELERGAAQFDLSLTVVDLPEHQRLLVEYNTDLFEPATARRLLGHYANLLRAAAAEPGQRLSALPWLDENERRQLLVDFNDTARPYPRTSLAELFEAQAARTPEAPALLLGDQALSFDALNRRANQMAHYLQSLGVGAGAFVGICLERSFDQLAALLAVLKVGAAYVPLDPAYPADRLRYMLEDCGAAVVLVEEKEDLTPRCEDPGGRPPPAPLPLREGGSIADVAIPSARLAAEEGGSKAEVGLSATGLTAEEEGNKAEVGLAAAEPAAAEGESKAPGCAVIALEAMAERLAAQSEENLGLAVPIDAPAYVVYTSGSTGRPKGVVAPHRGALNHCQWVWDAYPFAPGEVACHKTSLSFVDSVVEIFSALLADVPLALVPDSAVKDPPRLIEILAAHGVTRLMLLPSLLRAMLSAEPNLRVRLPKLNLVAAGSEILDSGLVADFQTAMPGAGLLNWYGSSEDSGDVSCFDCRAPRPAGVVPIGRPLSNTELYILDAHRQPVPIGVLGELYAGGAGIALGYHNRPELNAERFVPNPFCDAPGAVLYRTGDLARFLPDGNILYLGRRDRQVKVRGVRIELDEVQSVMALHPQVEACAVRVNQRRNSARGELAAYYVARPGANLATAELRRHLAQRLPESMLPAWFVRLEALPTLPNGKVNFAALPEPDPADYRRQAGQRVPPRTLLEMSLARLWAECLGMPDVSAPMIGVTDNFFELGGHSLLAASLFARIQATLGLNLPLALLFQSPTIADLAAAIAQGGHAPAQLTSLVPLKPSGTRPPFFCVHPLGGGVGDYAALAQHLHPQQPFYGLRAKGLEDENQHGRTFEELAADYTAEIRTIQPSGPYRLGGYSSGGLLAFEMARQLTAAGEAVALVALLDSYAPRAPGPARMRPAALLNMATTLPHWLSDLSRQEPGQIVVRLRRWRRAARHGRSALTAADFIDPDLRTELPPRHRAFIEAHFKAEQAYAPEPYTGSVTLFRAKTQALSQAADPDKGWRALALGGVDIREFPGSHHTLLTEPHVRELAQVIQKRLDEIEDAVL